MNNIDTIDMVISDLEDRIKSTNKSIALNEEGCEAAINEKNELLKNNATPDKIEDVDKLISMYKDIIENRKKHKEGYLKDLEEWKKLKEEQENGRH